MTGTVLRKPSAQAAPYWGMLQGLSKPLKLELVVLLSESMEDREVASTPPPPPLSEEEKDQLFEKLAGCWADRDNEMLDAALAKFSGDFGGNKDASEVARELRQGAEMVRDVDTW